jgi:hypothetical protein
MWSWPMFANLTSLLPLISVASVLLVSANTIGYFQRIGIHFLGLMDLSNFIYPLGLAFFGVLLVLQAIPMVHIFLTRWQKLEEFDVNRLMTLSLIVLFAVGVAPILLADFFEAPKFYVHLAMFGTVIGMIVTPGFMAFVLYQRNRRKLNLRAARLLTVSIVGIVAGSYTAGLTQADYQAFQTPTLYRIINKHGFDTVVRIIRASSAGLLVSFPDRKIAFIPKEEIRLIESDAPKQ